VDWDALERNYGLAEERFGKQRGQGSNPIKSPKPSEHKYIPVSDDDMNSNISPKLTNLHDEKAGKDNEMIEDLKRWFATQESRYVIKLQNKAKDLMVILEKKSAPACKWISALRRATEIAMADYKATEERINKQVLAGMQANRAFADREKAAVEKEEAEGKADL
jgi:hypothetical protein